MSTTTAPTAEAGTVPTPTIPRRGLRAALHDALVIMERSLRVYQREPQVAFFMFVQPVMFVLLFRYVFGGSIRLGLPGFDYVQYLMPGIVVQAVAFSSIGTAIGITEDLKAGIIDRFRSLPMAHSAVLAGKVLADTFLFMLTVIVMATVGYLVGFRVTTSLPEALAALALIVAFGFAVSWISAWIGLTLKEPEAVQSGGFVWMFPVVFASSVFVVPAMMPRWPSPRTTRSRTSPTPSVH